MCNVLLDTSKRPTATLPAVKIGLGYKICFSHTNQPDWSPAEDWDTWLKNAAER